MFKVIKNNAWIFDTEWIPDPISGKALYGLDESASDREVIEEMWKKGGATDEDPMPYLKTALCRLVSISAITRSVIKGNIKLHLLSLPRNPKDQDEISEAHIIETFLKAVGNYTPQLIGFNSHASDLKILLQRGLACGIQAKKFCKRPERPWEGPDYFVKGNDWNIDLKDIVGGWGKSTPSLNEMAAVCGIPGKISVNGQDVAPLWLEGKLDKIIAYNEFDAVTTYLLWLRVAYFGGFFTQEEYDQEQELLRKLLISESEKPERSHLKDYLSEWERLSERMRITQ
ncbi:3'-5' exonuclease [Candidatus Magnetomoraceae bacterium gMMP-15]